VGVEIFERDERIVEVTGSLALCLRNRIAYLHIDSLKRLFTSVVIILIVDDDLKLRHVSMNTLEPDQHVDSILLEVIRIRSINDIKVVPQGWAREIDPENPVPFVSIEIKWSCDNWCQKIIGIEAFNHISSIEGRVTLETEGLSTLHSKQ
jgi:hypothetical protein